MKTRQKKTFFSTIVHIHNFARTFIFATSLRFNNQASTHWEIERERGSKLTTCNKIRKCWTRPCWTLKISKYVALTVVGWSLVMSTWESSQTKWWKMFLEWHQNTGFKIKSQHIVPTLPSVSMAVHETWWNLRLFFTRSESIKLHKVRKTFFSPSRNASECKWIAMENLFLY